jgi:hypothetical protein
VLTITDCVCLIVALFVAVKLFTTFSSWGCIFCSEY